MRTTVPNLLSLLRMVLVPVFILAVLDGRSGLALGIFLFAGITDALDGAIARHFHQQTLLGTYLDPIADKLLVTSAYILLTLPERHTGVTIPLWVTALVLARDLLILLGVATLYLVRGIRHFPPTRLSKINTVVQVVTVAAVLLTGPVSAAEPLAKLCLVLVTLSTLASAASYAPRIQLLTGDARRSTTIEPRE